MEEHDEGVQFAGQAFSSYSETRGEGSSQRRWAFIAAVALGCTVAVIATVVYLRRTPYDEMVGRLKFDMSESEVRSVLGNPDDFGRMSLPDGTYKGVNHQTYALRYHVSGSSLPLFVQFGEDNGPVGLERWCELAGEDGHETPSLGKGPEDQTYLQGKIVCHEIPIR